MRHQTKIFIDKILAAAKLLSIELLIVLIAFISSFATVVFFIKLIFLDNRDEFDHKVFEMIKPLISDSTTTLMKSVTVLGSHYFLIPANLLLIIYSFFFKKDKWFAIKIASVAISSLVLMFSLKYVFNRPRPLIPLLEEVPGLSFPSGHAFMSFAFFGLVIYLLYQVIKNAWLKYSLVLFFFLLITLIGFSRVYLRVHYASDVFAGFSLGLIWLVISLFILGRIEKNRSKMPAMNEQLKN